MEQFKPLRDTFSQHILSAKKDIDVFWKPSPQRAQDGAGRSSRNEVIFLLEAIFGLLRQCQENLSLCSSYVVHNCPQAQEISILSGCLTSYLPPYSQYCPFVPRPKSSEGEAEGNGDLWG